MRDNVIIIFALELRDGASLAPCELDKISSSTAADLVVVRLLEASVTSVVVASSLDWTRGRGSLTLPSVQSPLPNIETARVPETVDLTPAPPLEEQGGESCAQIDGPENIPTALVTNVVAEDDCIDWKLLEANLMEEDLDDIIFQSWGNDVSVPSMIGPGDSIFQSGNIHSKGGLTEFDDSWSLLDDPPCPKLLSPGNL
ncbi:uncharacterized protein LOC144704814 isoform X2 [Wolffia australiana]